MPFILSSFDLAVATNETLTASLDVHISDPYALLDVHVADTPNSNINLSVNVAIGPKVSVNLLDVYVQTGTPSSMYLFVDTTISVPVISGPLVASDLISEVEYVITNLDADIVEIIPGPNTIGLDEIVSFTNNGDGTGTMIVRFDPVIIPRKLSIQAKDDVDNISAESNILVVFVEGSGFLNSQLSLVPQRLVWSDTCDRLLDSMPETKFINRGQYNVPYSFNKTPFELRAVDPTRPIAITVTRMDLQGDPNRQSNTVIIPESELHLVNLSLGRGKNIITANDGIRTTTIFVVATTYTAVECSYAKEIFNFALNEIEEQERAIFSPISTRLAEPYIDFQQDLPEIKSLQILATKLAVRSVVNETQKQSGVRDLLTALTLSTPIFVPEENPLVEYEPNVFPLFSPQEAFGGVDAHVWMQNSCVTQWVTFLRYLNNIEPFQILSVSESEIIFKDNNGEVTSHRFDFNDDDCSLLARIEKELCFASVSVAVSIFSEFRLVICAAQYPFDLCIINGATEDGVRTARMDILVDGPATETYFPVLPLSDENTPGGLDPGFTALDGLCVVDRFDGGNTLDSGGSNPQTIHVDPNPPELVVTSEPGLLRSAVDISIAPEPQCVFESYVVTPQSLASADIDDPNLEFNITATGTGESQQPPSTMMDVLAAATVEQTFNLDLIVQEQGIEISTDTEVLVGAETNLTQNISLRVAQVSELIANMDVLTKTTEEISTSLDINIV